MQIEFLVYRVDTGDEMRDYLALVESEIVFSRGLVPEAIIGVLSRLQESDEPITPEIFSPHRLFVEFLHQVIARHAPNDPGFQAEAQRLRNGWIYIIDQRTPDPAGAVPPEDVIGGIQIANGKMIPESYLRNPNHLIFSSKGLFDLGPSLNGMLLNEVLSYYSRI